MHSPELHPPLRAGKQSRRFSCQAFKFHKSSRALKRQLRWRNAKCLVVTCGILTGLLLLLIMYSCGLTLSECRIADVSNLAHPGAAAAGAGWSAVGS